MCSQAWDITDRIRAEKSSSSYGYEYSLGPDIATTGDGLNMSFVAGPHTSFKDSAESLWNHTSLLDVYIMSMLWDNSTDCKPPLCGKYYSGRNIHQFRPSAFVFSLSPCVQTFYASVVRGVYSEKVISEEYLHHMPQYPRGSMWQLAMNRSIINGKWQQCTGTATPNEINTVRVDSIPAGIGSFWIPHNYYPPECVFEFYQGYYLADFLGTSFFSPATSHSSIESKPLDGQLWRHGTTDIDVVTSFAKGLALAISTQMRTDTTGPEMLREVRGTTLVEKTCIRIHWGYIAFFAVVFTLEVLFLGTVVVMGSRSRLHTDWKSSALAVAFLSAGESQKGGWPAENFESDESLQEAARSIKASLMLDDLGHWRLKAQKKSWGAS